MIKQIASILCGAMLLPVVAFAYSTDIAVAAKQPCVTIAEATQVIYKSRGNCAAGTIVTYFNVCKGQVFSGNVLPVDTILHDSMCITDVATNTSLLPTSRDIFGEVANGQTSQALADIMRVLQANPNSSKAHWVLANVLYQQGKLDAAKVEFKKAELLDPTDSFGDSQVVNQFRAKLFFSSLEISKRSYKFIGIVIAILLILIVILFSRSRRTAAAEQAQAEKPRATVYPIRPAADPYVPPAPLPIVDRPEPETKGDDKPNES